MWTSELISRFGHVLLVIYKDGETIGSLQFLEGDSGIQLWELAIKKLNNEPTPANSQT